MVFNQEYTLYVLLERFVELGATLFHGQPACVWSAMDFNGQQLSSCSNDSSNSVNILYSSTNSDNSYHNSNDG